MGQCCLDCVARRVDGLARFSGVSPSGNVVQAIHVDLVKWSITYENFSPVFLWIVSLATSP